MNKVSMTRGSAMKNGRRREKREGAAMLIVLMVLLMTTATATFAIHSTTIEIRSAGYARQSLQASYLAENSAYASVTFADGISHDAIQSIWERTSVAAGSSADANDVTLTREAGIVAVELDEFDSSLFNAPPLETDPGRVPSFGPYEYQAPSFRVLGRDPYKLQRARPGQEIGSGDSAILYARINMAARSSIAPPSDFRRSGDERDFHETTASARATVEIGPIGAN